MTIDLSTWKPVNYPTENSLSGLYCDLVKIDPNLHSESLYTEFTKNESNSIWDYLPYGPFNNSKDFNQFIDEKSKNKDPKFFAIIDKKDSKAIGFCSYLRIDTTNGVIEIGHIAFSPRLQKTRLATEAVFLLIKYALSLGYRRIEWKCNNENISSKNSAARFGFTFEGIFRQAAIVKGKNRDTAWYSIIDIESDKILDAFTEWLRPQNFDLKGIQIRRLSEIYNKQVKTS